MAKTKLTRNGVTIYVAAAAVAAHELQGWKTSPEAKIEAGVFSLDAVVVNVPAARLNDLVIPSVTAGTLGNLPLRHYQTIPAAISATYVHAAVTLSAVTQSVTTNITSPDVPRTVTVKGNASGNAGNVVINGTNISGEVISDTIALSGTSEVEGIKAFATVTQIDLPVQTHAGTDTVSVGIAKKFGLPHIVYNAACLLLALFNAAADTGGTLAVDEDEIEKNLYSCAGTPNGAKLLDLYYLA
jgi:hypothetical protein